MSRRLPDRMSFARVRLSQSLAVLAVTAVLGAAGCSSPFSYNTPPTAAAGARSALTAEAGRTAVVVGQFENPKESPVKWSGIGSGVSDALAATLLNHGDVDVWIDAPLAARIQSAVTLPTEQRLIELVTIRDEHPRVRYVVVGRVTDFAHSGDLDPSVRRWGLLGRKNEAVVALYINVIDLETGRVALTDHIHGVAPTPKRSTAELYEQMSFGTYLFWNSPLGKASEQAIVRASDVVHRVLPDEGDSIMIASQVGRRELKLVGEVVSAETRGRLHYVCLVDNITGELTPVPDADSGKPLLARLDGSGRAKTTAWLLGRKPLDIDLKGALLLPVPPDGDFQFAEAALPARSVTGVPVDGDP